MSPSASADNKRLNNGVAANVYTIHRQQKCPEEVAVNPQLQLAAEWHTNDVLNDRALDGDTGSDGSSVQDRTNAAGYQGIVAETVAINPALAISGIEILNQWYSNPAYLAIMRDCTYTQVGVWSANSLDRTVVVAVYGRPDEARSNVMATRQHRAKGAVLGAFERDMTTRKGAQAVWSPVGPSQSTECAIKWILRGIAAASGSHTRRVEGV